MKQLLTTLAYTLPTVSALAEIEPISDLPSQTADQLMMEPLYTLLPILFMSFLVFMVVALIKYFLEFRLKNKLIERGMAEQLSTYLLDNNPQEKQHGAFKWAILFCGIGAGLTFTYLTAPVGIHSLAIMAFCLGLSYFAYFVYLRKSNNG